MLQCFFIRYAEQKPVVTDGLNDAIGWNLLRVICCRPFHRQANFLSNRFQRSNLVTFGVHLTFTSAVFYVPTKKVTIILSPLKQILNPENLEKKQNLRINNLKKYILDVIFFLFCKLKIWIRISKAVISEGQFSCCCVVLNNDNTRLYCAAITLINSTNIYLINLAVE